MDHNLLYVKECTKFLSGVITILEKLIQHGNVFCTMLVDTECKISGI